MTALIFWKDQEIDRLRRDIDRIIRRCSRDLRVPLAPLTPDRPFPMDLSETDDALVLTAALPGIRREDMTISVTQDTLIIEAKSADQTFEEASGLRRVTEHSKTWSQKIRLSRSADTDHIQASFKDEVLTILIPKRKQSRKERITIQVK